VNGAFFETDEAFEMLEKLIIDANGVLIGNPVMVDLSAKTNRVTCVSLQSNYWRHRFGLLFIFRLGNSFSPSGYLRECSCAEIRTARVPPMVCASALFLGCAIA
jgi:hypothetical protein